MTEDGAFKKGHIEVSATLENTPIRMYDQLTFKK